MPTGSTPAAILIDTLPFTGPGPATVFVPIAIVSEPVGVGLPVPPLTATVTVRICAVVIVDGENVADTVGVDLLGAPTETVVTPLVLLYKEALAESGV